MEAPGPVRLRGFRAPAPGEAPADHPDLPAEPSAAGSVETMEVGREPRRRRRRRRWPGLDPRRALLAAAIVLIVAMVVIAGLAYRLGAGAGSASDRPSPSPSRAPAASATPLPVPQLYQQVVPSVVLITTSKGSLGSGTVVTDTGTILTANHVIAGGGTITVQFADGTKSAATLDSADPKTDSAMLIPKKLPEVVVPAALGGGVAVGSDVVAIGNPLGLRDSTSTGVVSGLGRTTKGKAGRTLTGLIQFDAAVNPGSSGGPLLDARGVMVGVVVSIADPGGDDAFAGIGFAVPIGAALGGGNGQGPGGGPQL